MTADAIESLTLAEVEQRIKLILAGEADDSDLPLLVKRLVLPTNRYGVPLDGEDYLLDAIADFLAPDRVDPEATAAINLRRMRWRHEYHDRKRLAHEIASEVEEEPSAEVARLDTRSDPKAVLTNYLRTMSSLLSPSRAWDTDDGPRSIGSPAHHDALDMEVVIGASSDEVKDFAFSLTMDPEQRDMAAGMGVSEPTDVALGR